MKEISLIVIMSLIDDLCASRDTKARRRRHLEMRRVVGETKLRFIDGFQPRPLEISITDWIAFRFVMYRKLMVTFEMVDVERGSNLLS